MLSSESLISVSPVVQAPHLHDVDGIGHRQHVHNLQQHLDDVLPPVEAVVVQHHPVRWRLLLLRDVPVREEHVMSID